jgi:hypothetical protein
MPIKAFLFMLCVVQILPAQARSMRSFRTKPDTTLSIDTGYAPPISSNRAMRNFAVEFEHFGELGFNWLSDDTFMGGGAFGRILILGIGTGILWTFGFGPVQVANHEMGHGSHAQAMGLSARYAWKTGSNHNNIFSFVADGYSHLGESAYTRSSGVVKHSPDNWDLAVSAGGMNNSAMLAEAYEDEVLAGRGHVNQILHYYTGKFDAHNYARYTQGEFATGGDVVAVINMWAARGINVSRDNIANGGSVSLFGSSTFYGYLWGLGRYIVNGDPTVRSIMIGDVKLPDLSFFQNRDGLSYRVRSAIVGDDSNFIFSAENIYHGRSASEISAGWRWFPSKFGRGGGGLLQAFGCTRGGGGLRAEKSFQVGRGSTGTLGVAGFSVNSLEGEREITVLASDKAGGEVYARWSFIY